MTSLDEMIEKSEELAKRSQGVGKNQNLEPSNEGFKRRLSGVIRKADALVKEFEYISQFTYKVPSNIRSMMRESIDNASRAHFILKTIKKEFKGVE